VFINQEKIIDAQMGVAICTPIVGIPPRNVLVAFEKPFEDRKRGIAFNRGCCWGMRTISPEEFLSGVNEARGIRGWPQARDPHGSLFGPGEERPAADATTATTKKKPAKK
jgi:hypothetical protein